MLPGKKKKKNGGEMDRNGRGKRKEKQAKKEGQKTEREEKAKNGESLRIK